MAKTLPANLIHLDTTVMADQNEIARITNIIVDALDEVDLESALTVICNLAGQLVCALAEGRPSGIKEHGKDMAENIMKAAIAKALHDDQKRREAEEKIHD